MAARFFLVMGFLFMGLALTLGSTVHIARSTEPVGQPSPFADILLYNGNGMGGVGRLVYQDSTGLYQLSDGIFTPHVIESGTIRAMRPDEGGGSMAIPVALAAPASTVVGLIASYNTLLEMDINGTVLNQVAFGPVGYGGGGNSHFVTHKGNIYFASNGTFYAYGPDLTPLGTVDLSKIPYLSSKFILVPETDHVYFFNPYDPGPAMDCVGPDRCGTPAISAVLIDISNPKVMKLDYSRDIPAPQAPTSAFLQGVDEARQTWLLISGGDGEYYEVHDLKTPEVLLHRQKTLTQIVAMTDTAPFVVVTEDEGKNSLSVLTVTDAHEVQRSSDLDLHLSASSRPQMVREGSLVYIATGNSLRIVDISGPPRLVLSQDFTGLSGQLFSFATFALAHHLPVASTTAEAGRIKALLALDYLSPERLAELEAQMNKLSSADDWALPLLTSALTATKSSAYSLRPLAINGLAKLGPTAQPAVPEMLNATMEGASIRGDVLPKVQVALRLIDAEGMATVAALPAFISSHYEAGAKHVAREVLGNLSGPAAQAALPLYK